MKKVLFVTSEAVPFIKTGGLADVAGSLPRYFDKTKYDVRIILPKYVCMDDGLKEQMRFHSRFYVKLSWRSQYVGVLETKVDGITYYFIDNEYYFAGTKPYNNIYEDVEKFAYFSKAVLEALPVIGFCPDILHCHDWQTGLIPVYLKNGYQKDEFYQGIRTIFTIHNLQFQGRWMIQAVKDITGLPEYLFTSDKLESYGEANYLKGGVVYSDIITTVSRTYAQEITTPSSGEGLDGLMCARRRNLYGIINGLDYQMFDPKADPYIDHPFSKDDLAEGKSINKRMLQKQLGFAEDDSIMMIGMVTRMTNQKGLELVESVLDELLANARIQIVALGTGQANFENMFRHYAWKYEDKLSANIYYSEELAHKIYAACDAFLMPSLFEPCGLSQLISMRYGTVPIVRETGGLKDTVEAYNRYEQTGCGFSFCNFNAREMLSTLYYAMDIYYNHREDWDAVAIRGMERDFSWSRSAHEYEKIYDQL
ncbi:MAG: glycogen synthase GlgA [Eubacterium sp.]|nr:glycogen synthase GlgA [Eubacterium sp.]MCI8917986.1 glycogen synthase GlgA [Eubacterium sp.]